MTVDEALVLLGILRAAYPRFYADMESKMDSKEAKKAAFETAKLWATLLSDINLEIAKLALQRLIVTCKFPPTIAEMRESIAVVKHVQLPDAGEAWAEVNQAICYYGYYRPEEGIASLSEMAQEAVRRIGWRELCTAPIEHEMANRAHFLKIYAVMEKRINETRLLPDDLKNAIAKIGQSVPEIAITPTAVIETQDMYGDYTYADDPFYKEFTYDNYSKS